MRNECLSPQRIKSFIVEINKLRHLKSVRRVESSVRRVCVHGEQERERVKRGQFLRQSRHCIYFSATHYEVLGELDSIMFELQASFFLLSSAVDEGLPNCVCVLTRPTFLGRERERAVTLCGSHFGGWWRSACVCCERSILGWPERIEFESNSYLK